MIDYVEKIFKMLNIKPNQYFKVLNSDRYPGIYYIDNHLMIWKHDTIEIRSPEGFSIIDIFLENLMLVPYQPLTNDEKLIIDYLKLSKFNWIARDKNNSLCAYVNKPKKEEYMGMWCASEGPTTSLCSALYHHFKWISYEDTEPVNINYLFIRR